MHEVHRHSEVIGFFKHSWNTFVTFTYPKCALPPPRNQALWKAHFTESFAAGQVMLCVR